MAAEAYPIIGLYVGIILFGYIFKRLSILRVEDSTSLVNLIVNFTLPAVVLKTFYKAPLEESMLYIFIISILFNLIMSGVGILLFRRTADKTHRGLLIISCAGFNIGLFAYPFVQAIWGSSGLLYIAMFDLGNAFIIFGSSYILAICYSPVKHDVDFRYIVKKLITFPSFTVYIIGIIFAFYPVTYPKIFLSFLDVVAGANSVLVLLVIGMFMSFEFDKVILKRLLAVLSLRYLFGFTVAIFVWLLLPVSEEIRQLIALALILPIGMAVIPYSVLFNYDKKLAGTLVNVSNVVSFVIMIIAVLFVFNL